ncbi:hypothetical protein BABINDRAFT_159366 [Babjeviella inositovora NRRL Y-12698]|uniref:Uncharacterized protein n=1 Tax=Babjeviella inositovora NRRL Y-12698 TaxID=984486 RepID=A0A1E3QZ07_9ASCO|nr:uncharacterized protein BABINDRAFT_159366 [Babjeviella inositovora NRRL Y-12698]ODQ82868.1 hypothetical protein BABINDRAFT_159366 [Babjeviella inositovora NRRL Y-12698]
MTNKCFAITKLIAFVVSSARKNSHVEKISPLEIPFLVSPYPPVTPLQHPESFDRHGGAMLTAWASYGIRFVFIMALPYQWSCPHSPKSSIDSTEGMRFGASPYARWYSRLVSAVEPKTGLTYSISI